MAAANPHRSVGVRAEGSPERPARSSSITGATVTGGAVAPGAGAVVGVVTGGGGGGGAGAASPTRRALTTSRCLALSFGLQVVRVSRLSFDGSRTLIWL